MEPELQEKLDQALKRLKSLDDYNRITLRNLAKAFVLGVFTAFGATVGLALFLAILGYLLHAFGALPGVGSWFASLGQYIHK